MYRPVVANGYFAGEDSSTFVKFPADEYTVVAGDEWGQLSIAYFTVIAG